MRLLIVVFLGVGPIMVFGQTVSNVLATLEGEKIYVKYDLKGEPKLDYSIDIRYSVDSKDYSKTPKLLTGEFGDNQKAGTGKVIVWDAKTELDDFDGLIRFKVAASITAPKTSLTKTNMIENEHFKLKYMSSEKIPSGFIVKAQIETKKSIRSSFSRTSYTVDNLNKIYNLSSVFIAGVGLIDDKFDFSPNTLETIEITFINKFVSQQGDSIKGLSLTYGKGSLLLNL